MEEDKIVVSKLLVVGGSAGSLDVLIKVLPLLDVLNELAIVIVLHRKNSDDKLLEELIALKTTVPVHEVEDKTPIEKGYIYVAPSDYHLLFEKNGLLGLDISDKVNYSRPSIDVVFQSAADAYGSSVTGLLLSGANADGTDGLIAIKQAGGTVAVQSPETAEIDYMPRHAIEHILPDAILRTPEMAAFILALDKN